MAGTPGERLINLGHARIPQQPLQRAPRTLSAWLPNPMPSSRRRSRRVGGQGIARQHAHGRLTARERLELLTDQAPLHRARGLGGMGDVRAYGGAPGAGVVVKVGVVSGRLAMIIANDATVKAGAFFPMTCKKIIRAQCVAQMAGLPLIYLVDSAGVFLPLQEDVFPDTDDFGRIFRNNAVFSSQGLPQIAAIMGNCVAGGGYLPVLCDTLVMTEGSGLYLAGPALVKAAIGQEVDSEELGGASMHSEISGTVDFHEPDDPACIERLRRLMLSYNNLPEFSPDPSGHPDPARAATDLYDIFKADPRSQYDTRELLECFVDADSMDCYKSDYGRSLVCCYARIEGRPCGIVANQLMTQRKMPGGKAGPSSAMNMPAVIYDDSADKAADSSWTATSGTCLWCSSATRPVSWSGATASRGESSDRVRRWSMPWPTAWSRRSR